MRITVAFLIAVITAVGGTLADYHYVATNGTHSSPFTNWAQAATNIQDAVIAANDGDVVLITNGTYVSSGYVADVPSEASNSMVVIIKGITLRSVNGAAVSILEGNYPAFTNRGIFLGHTNAVVEELKIQGGRAERGGGVYITNGILRNCIFVSNIATSYGGGGVYCYRRGLIDNCGIYSNSVTSGRGGGMMLQFGGTALNCTVSYNYSSSDSGGIYVSNPGTASNCVIISNNATSGGGCTLDQGGYFFNCLIISNFATGRGGGVNQTGGTMRNCLIVGNSCNGSGQAGGGVYVEGPYNITLESCTIARNSALYRGGGIYANGKDTPSIMIRNTIIWSNQAGTAGMNWYNTNGVVATNYLCVCTTPDLDGGTGNITNHPLFKNLSDGDYRLQGSSPCVNTGTNQSWMNNARDLEGNARIMYGIVDMGAYECIYEGNIYRCR